MRSLRVLLFALLLVVLGACQVDTDVVLEMAEDGSGTVTVTVTLDPEAAARVPDLADQLATDDLVAAGWEITGPSTVEGGSLEITATKPFADPDEAAAVLTEIGGPDGVLQDVSLDRSREFARTSYSFSATADASGGVAALADEGLVELLGGDGFGGQIELIESETGASVDDQVTMELEVSLPGASETFVVEPGEPAEELALESQELRPLPLLLVALGVVSFVAGVVLLLTRFVGRIRRKKRDRPDSRPLRGVVVVEDPDLDEPVGAVRRDEIAWAGEGVEPGAAAAGGTVRVTDAPAGPPPRKLQLVVLDVMGVVFPTGADVPERLTAFARQRGSTLDVHAVASSWALAAEGRLTVGELWASLGLTDDPGDLSDEFLAQHRIRPGVRTFLERMQARELPVAGIADDIAEWSRKLRSTHKLDHLTRAWVISGDVGERLPAGSLLGRVIQVTGIEARNALLISDRVACLDAARSFGFAGALFVEEGQEPPENAGYPVISSFDGLAP
jgi:FMN phosphatase YigB (HAD superfamily)